MLAVTAIATGCDQHTKVRAIEALSDLPGQSMAWVDPWIRFSLAFNRGTAFSIVRDAGSSGWVFGVLAVLVAVLVGVWLWREGGRTECLGAGLIAGGALGNGYDRLFRQGVVDFVSVGLPGGLRWPTFNVADAALVVGVLVLAVAALRARTARAASPVDAAAAEGT
jgi:signal peptidase II